MQKHCFNNEWTLEGIRQYNFWPKLCNYVTSGLLRHRIYKDL